MLLLLTLAACGESKQTGNSASAAPAEKQVSDLAAAMQSQGLTVCQEESRGGDIYGAYGRTAIQFSVGSCGQRPEGILDLTAYHTSSDRDSALTHVSRNFLATWRWGQYAVLLYKQSTPNVVAPITAALTTVGAIAK